MTYRAHRQPSGAASYITLILTGAAILGTVLAGAPIQFGVVAGTAIASVSAMLLGWSWEELEKGICARIGKLCDTMLIMWMIGFLLGSMLYSGLLPMLVYYGFQVIRPEHLYFSGALACMLMSTMTGSSWTSAGTAGVACMALCHGLGADPGIMAGAVVAGAVFGDKISPMSETTNLAPACAGTDLYSHVRSQLWTTVPSIGLALVIYLIAGNGLSGSSELPEQAVAIMSELDGIYNWSPLLLLPVALLLLLSLRKKPPVPVMAICGGTNLLLGKLVQGFSWKTGFTAAITGFKSEYAADASVLSEKTRYVLDRGGMTSMVSIILICFCGFAMTTVLTEAGFMERAVRPLIKLADSRWKAMLTAELATLAVASMAGISYMSSVFVGEAWREPFRKNDMGPACLSRTLEDVGTCCTAVVPWCSSAAFFAGTLGVAAWGAGSYGLWCVLPFACPAMVFLLSVLGKGMYPEPADMPVTESDR